MVQLSLVEILVVTSDEDSPRLPLPHAGSGGMHGDHAGPPNMSLADIAASAPDLLVPNYLPDGFVLSWGSIARPERIMLSYKRRLGETLSESIDILEEGWSGSIKVQEGFLHEVTVGQIQGYYLDGAWTIRHEHSPSVDQIAVWEAGRAATLIFERDSRWIMLSAVNPGRLSEDAQDELIRVGSSLEVYKVD